MNNAKRRREAKQAAKPKSYGGTGYEPTTKNLLRIIRHKGAPPTRAERRANK
jgi:hypothetical protein